MEEKQEKGQPVSAGEKAPSAPPARDNVGRALTRALNPGRWGSFAARGARCVRERGWEALGRELSFRAALAFHRDTWRHRADIPLRRELTGQRQNPFGRRPRVSILVPVYRTPVKFFREMVKSVLAQTYPEWELVLADAGGPGHDLRREAEAFHDGRIRYLSLEKNEGIAGNTNRALAAATGDWLALLDHDDVLYPNALFEVMRALNEDEADFVYSDEIILGADLKKLVQYHFKPGWCPEELQGCNYITHFSAFSRRLLEAAGGGERSEYDGSQDYDLILRLTEKARRIVHIPKVLYVWRSHAGSTAQSIGAKPYALEAGKKALEAHLERIGFPGTAEIQPEHPGTFRPVIGVKGDPLVTVMIPNKDHADDLERCLSSLYRLAGWDNFEVLVLENNSADPATFAFYKEAEKRYARLRVLTYAGPFNFSAVNNFGAQAAQGEHLLLLNNDIEITSPGFLRELLSYSQQPGVGAVGAKLLYPDGTVQHAGVIIGLGGTAGHSHKGLPGTNGGDLNRLVTTQNYLAVTGACLMVKTALYRALGGLDETRFAVAYNDVDFCLRLVEAGLRNVFTPYAGGVHYESKSRGYDTAGPNLERYNREKENFIRRYAGRIAAGDPCYNPHFTYLYENYGYR